MQSLSQTHIRPLSKLYIHLSLLAFTMTMVATMMLAPTAQARDISVGVGLGGYDFGLSLEFQGYYEHIRGSNFGARAAFSVSFSDAFDDDTSFYGTSGAAPDSSITTIGDYKDLSGFDVYERGLNTTLTLDMLYDLTGIFSMERIPFTASVYVGPRINSFAASVEVDNATASVSAKQFGFGFGALAFLPIQGDRLRLVGDIGLDLYLNPTLQLSDRFGDKDIKAEDNIYESYNELIRQPAYAPRIKLGIIYTF